jgi:pyridoxal phosphate enzyme (YggS family)
MTAASVLAYRSILARIEAVAQSAGRDASDVQLVAVSKTFGVDDIVPLLDAGHRVFGENRVQEAEQKWPQLKQRYAGIELHLIGPLQSNKVDQAVKLFDVIETVDRPKIASALAKAVQKVGRNPRFLMQINIGEEPQKAGIPPADAEAFLNNCKELWQLNIAGVMCIPPVDHPPEPYFERVSAFVQSHKLDVVSMGMSADFEAAIQTGATHVRVGSAIFGVRTQNLPA